MELLIGISIAFSVLYIVSAMLVNHTLKRLQKEIDKLEEDVFGTCDSFSIKNSLRGEIHKNLDRVLSNQKALCDLLQGLPNLYKDDIELFAKVKGYTEGYFLTISSYNDHPQGVMVVFKKDGTDCIYNSYDISEVKREVGKIKTIQEKCCPKKGKK